MQPVLSTLATAADEASDQHIADAVCTHCGCLCDDIQLTVRGSRIVAAERACPAGQRWFFEQTSTDEATAARTACRIDGQPAAIQDGIERAARLLVSARAPLVYGLTETSTAAQRSAAAIADWLGANLDTPTSRSGPLGLGLQGIGEVTATLGEIANRGDLVIYWGCDPATQEPRHFERYSLDRVGMFVERGRADRTCIVVDQERTRTAEAADLFILLRPDAHFAALWTLRALVQGVSLDPVRVEQSTGQPLATWQAVADHMGRARYGAIFFTPELSSAPGGHWNAEAALALVHDLNAHTRFVTRTLRGPGNPAGADNVLAWRTGYPYAINFAAGYPRFNPDDYAARQLLARGEVDAALFVAADPLAEPELARKHVSGSFPLYVAVDWRSTVTIEQAAVSFSTATYGIHQSGIVCRTDDVPLPLRAALPTALPSDTQILQRLEQRIRQLQAEGDA